MKTSDKELKHYVSTETVRTLGVAEMSPEERPREKAVLKGIKSLTNVELMAILFRTGVSGNDVMSLSREILDDYQGHLSQVARMSVDEMCARYKGLGTAKATTLLAALEIGARASADAASQRNQQILSSESAYQRMAHHFQNLDHEEFWILLLNNGLRVIREVSIAKGGINATSVDIRIIMKEALSSLASAIIVFHNHPSGTIKPSAQDDDLTRKIKQAAGYFDIRLNDHLIITDSGFYSYHDNGRL